MYIQLWHIYVSSGCRVYEFEYVHIYLLSLYMNREYFALTIYSIFWILNPIEDIYLENILLEIF